MKQQKVEKMNNNQVILYELDNQNKDSENFENSEIKSIQIQVDFDKQLNNTVRDLFLRQDSENKVIDVGMLFEILFAEENQKLLVLAHVIGFFAVNTLHAAVLGPG